MWPWHSSTVQQTSASFTDQKLRKENTIFKTIHLLTAETDVSIGAASLLCFWNQTGGKRSFLTSSEMLTSTLPVVLLVLKLRLFIWNIYSSVFSTVFHLQKWRKAFSTFCKSLIFHIGFSDFDMVNLSNVEIVFYPFMTVAWVPHAPFFRRNVAYFQFLEKRHRSLMCMLRLSKLTADSVTSSTRVIHAHYLHCHGENVEGRSVRVCGKHMPLYIFLYSDSVTFLSFVFVLQKKKKK